MSGGFDRRPREPGPGKSTLSTPVQKTPVAPGKRTLTEPYGHGAAPSATAPSELPHRAEMERSFGRSLDHVQAYTGMAAELAPHGAQALATGNVVAFADAKPAPPIVAHEVTHAVQNQQAGMAAPMASGVVAPRDSAAEAEADAIAGQVAAHGPGVRLPPITAAPAAHVHLAPKLLVPAADAPAPRTTIQVPDADHPLRRDIDGEPAIQTDKASEPGKAAPLRGKSWKSLIEVAESVDVKDDSGDTLHIDLTYRLESRPAEVGEVPDVWIHTERKALLTIGSGEHAGATIVGQARVRLAPDEARDPKAAIAKASVGADHRAQIYLAEAQQYVNVHGAGGRASLLADAADNDVLAYDDPLRTLIGLKNLLKQQHVAGHGVDVAKMHAQAQRLLAEAKRGCAVLEREIASVASHHDPHPGRIAPVRFLVGDIAAWLATNQQAGRDNTEDTRLVTQAHRELLRLLDAAEHAHAPKRDQLDDGLNAPVRFAERTAEGVVEVGAMAVDAIVLGVDALGAATGIGTFDFDPFSKYGKAIKASRADTTTALVTMVNGFADEWTDAIERAKHGDYRSLTDVSIDTLMMIDGARSGGTIALQKAEALAGKLGNVARSARAIASGLPAEARDIATAASRLPVEARNIAAAMADGADAFVARLRAGNMQMSTAGGGGGPGPGPNLGGLNAETLAEAAQAAKEAFKDKRLTQEAAKHAAAHTDSVGGESLREQLGAPAVEKLSKQLKPYEIEDLVRRVGAEEAIRIADSREGPALRDVYSEVALGRMREEAAEIRKALFPGKGIGKKNIAVAEAHLDDGVRMSTSSTSGPQGKAPKPKPMSQGGQFEPTKDSTSGRVMDTDPEYKTLSQLGEWVEKQYPNGAYPTGTVYLYTEMEMCASCAGIKAQFEAKFPGINVTVLADHPYPFPK
jgi:filamentous hemagglutinin